MPNAAATNFLSTQGVKGNLHVMAKGLMDRVIAKAIYIDSTKLTLTQDVKYRVIPIEADTIIVGGYLIADVLQNTTIDIGDATDDNEFGSAMTLNETATAHPWDDITMKYYAAADEVSFVPAATLTTAKFWIIVLLLPLSKV